MTEEQAISDYVDGMIQLQIDSEEKYNSERFAKLKQENPNWLADGKARGLPNAIQVANDILNEDKRYIYKKFRHGGFDPRNKTTRKLFFNLTGIKLPSTQRDTNTVLRSYIGEAYCIEQERLKQEAKDNEAAAKRQAADIQYAKEIDAIRCAFLLNKPIGGGSLVMLAEDMGIFVHPRTKGLLRRRVVEIQRGTARVKKGGSCQSAHLLWNLVESELLARNEHGL